MNYQNAIINPIVWNCEDHFIYLDDPYVPIQEIEYRTPVLDARKYTLKVNERAANQKKYERGVLQGIVNKSLAASIIQQQEDPLSLSDLFFNNGTPETNFADLANDMVTQMTSIKEQNRGHNNHMKSLAAAIISSKEYSVLQDSVVLGVNAEAIIPGVLRSAFDEVPTPNLTGKWLTLSHDLKWHENLAETESPEPSIGTGSTINIEIRKSGGSVAITERARQVINGADVYTRLISQLQQLGLKKENERIAAEIETNATTISGVDWGARSSGVSTNNPVDLFNTIRNTFSTKSQPVDGFTSKWLGYAELFNNDFVKGTNEPLRNVGQGGFQTAQFPILAGITYYADDSISSAVHGWAFSRQAIKIFRGPSRAYTVTDPDTETEKYVTKTHMEATTVDPSLIYQVTNITA